MRDSSLCNASVSSKPSTKDANVPRKTDFRSIFISDVHLGTKDCKASQLNSFLKYYSCDNLFLVGDIFDGWKMNSGIYWKSSFNQVIRSVLKLSKRGVNIYYITGNHDEFLRKYANSEFDNIHILNRHSYETAQNKKFLIIHGDQFESVTKCSRWLKYVGHHGYGFLMGLNRLFNVFRARYGYGYWSFSGFLKSHLKKAKQYIHNYEQAVAYGAKKAGYDGVICGHIHHASIKQIEGIRYCNTGDWVESCTALIETHEGELKLKYWLEDEYYRHLTKRKNKVKRASKLAASAE